MYKFTLQGTRQGKTCVLGNKHVFKNGVLIVDDKNGARMKHSLVKYYGVEVELQSDQVDTSKSVPIVPAPPSVSETATKTAVPGSKK